MPEQDAELQTFWNRWARYYRRVCHSLAYQRFVQDTLREAAIWQGARCVDLGCGPGFLAMQMHSQGGHVVGVDSSDVMIDNARRNVAEYKRAHGVEDMSLSFVRADVCDYLKSESDSSVDVAVASLLLAYVKEPERVISETFRVLSPGGRLVMSNPIPDAPFSRIFWRSGWNALRYLSSTIHLRKYASMLKEFERRGVFHFFTKDETVALLGSAGFDVSEVRISLTYAETAYLTTALKRS